MFALGIHNWISREAIFLAFYHRNLKNKNHNISDNKCLAWDSGLGDSGVNDLATKKPSGYI